MNNFNWQYDNNQYTANFESGKAIITEKKYRAVTIYNAEIQSLAGETITQISGLDEFETVEHWVGANLIVLDQMNSDDEFRKRLIETLNLCLSRLTDTNRQFHHARIANLKRWMLNEEQIPHQLPTTDWKTWAFDWQNIQDRFEANTTHGKAIIIETKPKQKSRFQIGVASRYKVQIEDEAGAIWSDTYLPSFLPSLDFLHAEARLRDVLAELEEPYINEVYLEIINFTLAICKQKLPSDTNIMHFVRINYLENYLGEVLP